MTQTTQPWFATYDQFNMQHHVQLPSEHSSLLDIFEQNLQQHAQQNAFIFMDKAIRFAELNQYSLAFASYLQSLNLAKGTRVAVMMPNLLQYPIAILGILRAGLILVNINPLYTTRELEHQLNDSGAEVLITVDRFAHVYQPIHGKTTVKHVIITGIGDMMGLLKGSLVNFVLRYVRKEVPAWKIDGHISFSQALQKVDASRYVRPTLNLSHTAVLQYTGGTTGIAKGAELTHGNLVANLLQVNSLFESRFGDGKPLQGKYFFCALPLYHIFSFTACLMYGMYSGATNILIANPRDLKSLIETYKKYPPTFFPAVNTLFNALLQQQAFIEADHSQLQASVGGGSSVLSATAQAWKKLTKTTLLEGYGLSETSPVVAFTPPNNDEYTASIGVPIPNTDVRLLDDQGQMVALGEAGEVCVKGPQVMKGYWNRPDETALVMTADGYFRTGDIGIMNEQGYIKIVDRKKDMILVSGFNVYPNEIEDVLSHHPKILEVAVIGVADEKSGEAPKAFIVKKDESLNTEEVLEYAKQNLTGYKRPRYVEFIKELPKSNVGKILRKDLR
ncbi:MAG: AMP-binding protein [Acinetobacter sp.]|nr:AMP-binding protein [Acinetobacter sp.]